MAGHPAGVSGAAAAGSERTDPTLQGVPPVRQHGAATPRGVRGQDSSGGEHREGGDLAVRSGVQRQPEAANEAAVRLPGYSRDGQRPGRGTRSATSDRAAANSSSTSAATHSRASAGVASGSVTRPA